MRISTLGLLTGLCCLSLLQAGETPLVGIDADLSRVGIEGATTFSADEIRWALADAQDVRFAAHPLAPRRDLIEALRRSTELAYLHAGFPAPTVTAQDRAAGGIALHVHEGRRHRRGGLVVVADALGDELESLLTKPRSRKTWTRPAQDAIEATRIWDPWWTVDEPPRFDPAWADRLANEVEAWFGEMGHRQAHVAIAVGPRDDGSALLTVTATAGPTCRIANIAISGSLRDRDADILACIGVPIGSPATATAIERIRERLRLSGRYLLIDVKADQADAADRGAVFVAIALRDHPLAPPLAQALDAREQALMRVAAWGQAWLDGRSDDDLVMRMPIAKGQVGTELRLEAILSPRLGGFALTIGRGDQPPEAWLARLIMTRERIDLADRIAHRRWRGRGALPVSPYLTIAMAPNADYASKVPADGEARNPSNFTFSLGWTSSSDGEPTPLRLTGRIDPVTVLGFARDPSYRSGITGDRLIVTRGEHRLEFAADSGRLLSWPMRPDAEGRAGLTAEPGALERLIEVHDQRSADLRDSPLSECLLDLLVEAMQLDPASAIHARGARELVSAVGARIAPALTLGMAKRDPPFAVPDDRVGKVADPMAVLSQTIGLWQHRLIERLAPPGSWPIDLSRTVMFTLSNRTRYHADTLRALYTDDAIGPAGCLAIAHVTALLGDRIRARAFADLGRQRLDAAHWERDLDLLEPSAAALMAMLRDIAHPEEVAALFPARHVQEIARLIRAAQTGDGDARTDLRALGQGIWKAGVRDALDKALGALATPGVGEM